MNKPNIQPVVCLDNPVTPWVVDFEVSIVITRNLMDEPWWILKLSSALAQMAGHVSFHIWNHNMVRLCEIDMPIFEEYFPGICSRIFFKHILQIKQFFWDTQFWGISTCQARLPSES